MLEVFREVNNRNNERMRVVIFGHEEPVYFSPFIRSLIEARSDEIVLIVIVGKRNAGSHPKTLKDKLESIYIWWLIMEPLGFFYNSCIILWHRLIRLLGPLGFFLDKRSIQGAARRYNIPVHFCRDLNSKEFIRKLHQFSPDVVINQTEILLKEEILFVPKIGVINRHPSLLPYFRGRLASWWSHAAESPKYGVTIHFLDKDLDSGPMIMQKKIEIDPRLSYPKVLSILFKEAMPLMLEALVKVQSKDFTPLPNNHQGTKTYLFPTLREAKSYRFLLKRRREEFALARSQS